MHQHQLEEGAGGASGKAPPGPVAGALFIQLPSTSAIQTADSQVHGRNASNDSQPYHRRHHQSAYPTRNESQTPAGAHQNWSSHRDTASSQTRLEDFGGCHRQAATRDLMLKHHQRSSAKHKYWRRSTTTGANASLLSAGRGELDESQQQASSIEILNATTVAVLSSTLADSTASNNESDNISDDSIPPPPNYHEIPGIVPSYHGRTSGPPPAYDDVVNPNCPPPSYQSLFGQVREARKTSNGLVDLLRQLFLVLIGTIGCTMIIGFLLLIPITMIFVGIFYINECRAENIPSFLVVGGFVWIVKNMLNCYNQFKKDSSSANRPPPRRATHLSATQPPQVASGPQNADSDLPVAPATTSLPGQGQASNQTGATMTTTVVAASTTRAAGQQIQPAVGATSSSGYQRQHRHVRQPQMIGLTSDKCESILNYFLIVWFLAGCIVVYRIYEPDYDNPLSQSYCNRTVYLYAFWLMTSAFIIMAIVLSCLCCLMASSLMSCGQGR